MTTDERPPADEATSSADANTPAGQTTTPPDSAPSTQGSVRAVSRRPGPVLIALIVVAIGVFGGFAYWRTHRHAPAAARSGSPAVQHYQNGLQLMQQGNSAGAAAEWETAIALDPAFPAPYIALSMQAEEQGDLPTAFNRLTALRAANPRAPHVECRQADLQFRANHTEKALALAREALRREPDCPLAHSVLGVALAESGDLPHAIEEMKTAHKLLPDGEKVTLTLAQMLAQAGHTDEAFPLIEPLASGPHPSIAVNYRMGWLLAEYGHHGKREDAAAQAFLTKVLAERPDHAPSKAELGAILCRQGRYKQAVPLLEYAAQHGVYTAETMQSLATAYARLGDARAAEADRQAKALVSYREALQHARTRYLAAPGDADNAILLARLEVTGGDAVDAMDLVRTVLQTDPNRKDALGLLNRIVTASAAARSHARAAH